MATEAVVTKCPNVQKHNMLMRLLGFLGIRNEDIIPRIPSFGKMQDKYGKTVVVRWLLELAWRCTKKVFNVARLLLVPDVMLRQTFAVILLQTIYELVKIVRALISRVLDRRTARGRQVAYLRTKLKQAKCYAEFREIRLKLSKLGRSRSNAKSLSNYTEEENEACRRLKQKADLYRKLIDNRDTESLKFFLRSKLLRKHWGVNATRIMRNKPRLYQSLEDYLDVVCSSLVHIAMAPPLESSLKRARHRSEVLQCHIRSTQEKLSFFNETRHSFGRSALLLSGGARMGLQHVGVVKAMMEQRLLPRVISGSSAGSIVAAMLGCLTDEEVRENLFNFHDINLRFFGRVDSMGNLAESEEPHPLKPKMDENQSYLFRYLMYLLPPPLPQWLVLATKLVPRWLAERTLLDSEVLGEAIRSITGDMTFQEAYDKTGRIINITVSPQHGDRDFPMLLNYLTAPQVVVWSAAVASSAIPGVFAPATLLAKTRDGRILPHSPEGMKWTDGSLENDLPMQRLSELFNVNHFIVSQVNVHARVLAPLKSSGVEATWPFMHGLEHILQFLRDQIRSYVKHVANLGLNTPMLKQLGVGLVPILTQKYLGDITIVPEFSVTDVLSLLNNPSKEEFRYAILVGERNTWPLLSKIRMSTMIELMLDDCVNSVRKRLTMMERKASSAMLRHSSAFRMDLDLSEVPENRAAYSKPRLPLSPGTITNVENCAEIADSAFEEPDHQQSQPLRVHTDDDAENVETAPEDIPSPKRVPPTATTQQYPPTMSLPQPATTPPVVPVVPVKLNRVASYQAPRDQGHAVIRVDTPPGSETEAKAGEVTSSPNGPASANSPSRSLKSVVDRQVVESGEVEECDSDSDRDDAILRHCNSDLAQRLKDRTQSVVGLAQLVRLGSMDKLPRLDEVDDE